MRTLLSWISSWLGFRCPAPTRLRVKKPKESAKQHPVEAIMEEFWAGCDYMDEWFRDMQTEGQRQLHALIERQGQFCGHGDGI